MLEPMGYIPPAETETHIVAGDSGESSMTHTLLLRAIVAATLGGAAFIACLAAFPSYAATPSTRPVYFISSPDAALEEAIRVNDPSAIARALADGASINAVNKQGVSPLMIAVDRQKMESVLTLLHAGADPNATAKDGASPVGLAVENFRAKPHGRQIMMAVFQAGGRPDTRRPNGDPVLMRFVNSHDIEGLQVMKSFGADLDARDRSNDPIITKAALGMDWDVVWCLIELGARFDYENGDARNPLSLSLSNKAPSRSSPLFVYKEKVWQRLRDAGINLPPLRN